MYDHIVRVCADSFTPKTDDSVPTGRQCMQHSAYSHQLSRIIRLSVIDIHVL